MMRSLANSVVSCNQTTPLRLPIVYRIVINSLRCPEGEWSVFDCEKAEDPPPLATGYFMVSGIGYSRSQSQL